MAGVEWAEYRHSSVTQVLSAMRQLTVWERKEVMPELGRYHLFRTVSISSLPATEDAREERLLICTTRPTGTGAPPGPQI